VQILVPINFLNNIPFNVFDLYINRAFLFMGRSLGGGAKL